LGILSDSANLVASDGTGNLSVTGVMSTLIAKSKMQLSGDLTWTTGLVNGGNYFIGSVTTTTPTTGNITLSSTFSGATIVAGAGTANIGSEPTGTTSNINGILLGGLNSANTYYLLSKDSGTGNITVANDINGPTLTLYDENGTVNVSATTDYVVNITASGYVSELIFIVIL